MSKYEHSDRLSLFRLTQELEADQGLSEDLDPERQIDDHFVKTALKILEAEDPESTHTLATAISDVLDHWIINGDLPAYYNGEVVKDPGRLFREPHSFAEKSPLILPRKDQYRIRDMGPDVDFFDDRIFIHKKDFKALCKRKHLPLPAFWFPPAVRDRRSMPPRTNPADPHAQTRAATEARQRKAVRRDELVEAFLSETDQRARDGDRNWNRSNMPVTKDDFCQTAQRVFPELKSHSNSAIVASVKNRGGAFMQGSKSRTNNALEGLFPAQMGGFRQTK